jgi:hypothetical protein
MVSNVAVALSRDLLLSDIRYTQFRRGRASPTVGGGPRATRRYFPDLSSKSIAKGLSDRF